MIAAGQDERDYERKGWELIQVERPGEEIIRALGLARREQKRRKKGAPTCQECFFHRHMLCALDLDEPCSTFRPDHPDGLVPPRQPALLLRQAAEEPEARAA
jgi:hypothetical protein